MDEKGQVFILDPKGKAMATPVSEPLASKVRDAIKRADALDPSHDFECP